MNAAAQRRLTPSLAAIVAIFGMLLLSLLFGMGRGVTWNPPRVTPPLPAVHNVALPAPPALDSYAQVWLHPLFSSDRKPIVTTGGSEGVSLGDLQLTGVIITPKLHIALLGPAHDNKGDDSGEVRVREGAMLPDGTWKLIKVLPRSAIFASPSGRTELKLPAGAPIDQAASSATAGAIPMNGPPGPGGAMPARPMPPPPPGAGPPPNDAQSQRLQRLRAAIQKQRSGLTPNAQGDH
ncbi:general secretion pathway protein GspN [Dyella psychrodurans]|uniref:General secretion pathway protein GspN n=1 Tax=Dyella psychrodurans TaxID=1927960 RepID=A0A370X4E6_9GAMM|nr:general secretion pathway protein GspN [Dyella psychrodurans]RDS83212.1 general secretion pathway protein GspN [Dyella psychrodurans]